MGTKRGEFQEGSDQLAESTRWSKMRLEKWSVVTLTKVMVFVICG